MGLCSLTPKIQVSVPIQKCRVEIGRKMGDGKVLVSVWVPVLSVYGFPMTFSLVGRVVESLG